jgi:hypothetical protein
MEESVAKGGSTQYNYILENGIDQIGRDGPFWRENPICNQALDRQVESLRTIYSSAHLSLRQADDRVSVRHGFWLSYATMMYVHFIHF